MLRKRVLDADILVIGTPIWLGQPSSVAKRVLERMDAFLDETSPKDACRLMARSRLLSCRHRGWRPSHRRRAVPDAAWVGFTIPTGGVTYWVGEAMGEKDYKDLLRTPNAVAEWTPLLASSAHLARLIKQKRYPGV